jgi:hypothetical protein
MNAQTNACSMNVTPIYYVKPNKKFCREKELRRFVVTHNYAQIRILPKNVDFHVSKNSTDDGQSNWFLGPYR